MGRTVFRTGSAHAQCGPHAGLTGCIELSRYVGNKQDFSWRMAEELGDAAIARGSAFGASCCIEIAGEKSREITRRRVGKEIALRLHATRREDRDVFACIAPPCESGSHVGIDGALAFAFSLAVSLFPA